MSRSATEQERTEHHYPNAGHLGLSSSASIYNRLSSNNDAPETSFSRPTPATPGSLRLSSRLANQQIQVLERALDTIDVHSLKNLMEFWLAKKVCLGLSSFLVDACTLALQLLLEGNLFDLSNLATVSQKISENSARALNLSSLSCPTDLTDQIGGPNVRWETIALAFILVGRATMDIPFFPPLYTCRSELQTFQRSLVDLSDNCLDIAISFDTMSEVQLICQYEIFVLHAGFDGDQSKSASPANWVVTIEI